MDRVSRPTVNSCVPIADLKVSIHDLRVSCYHRVKGIGKIRRGFESKEIDAYLAPIVTGSSSHK